MSPENSVERIIIFSKMLKTLLHTLQLVVHCYFMKQNFDSNTLEEFWNQIKYLTNISNLFMFLFLIPQLLDDFKFIIKKGWYTHIPRYSTFTLYAYQCMNPIIFIVMAMYWVLMYIDPKLVFGNRDWTSMDQVLLFYVHGGNWIMMQLNHLYASPKLNVKVKGLLYSFYVIFYFAIYGIHYYLFEEHVYGFQALLSKFELVAMYAILFAALFMIDYAYNTVLMKSRAIGGAFVQIKNS